MPYFIPNVRSLEGTPLVGNGDCAQLVKMLTPGLKGRPASMWKQGARVLDTTALRPGTAVATFVDGQYPDNESGQHAAFFLSYAGKAIWVMDQWKNDNRKPKVSSRVISPKPPSGGRLSNSSEAFYVIELR
jgi:hypothetical protein